MNIWKTLEIERTYDKKIIKKAYHTKLRSTNPEDNSEEFMILREAYEQALVMAENSEQDDFWDDMFLEDYEEDKNDEEEYEEYFQESDNFEEDETAYSDWQNKTQMQEVANLWWNRFQDMYGNLEKRWNSQYWKEILYNDIPFQLEYYERCRKKIYNALFESKGIINVFLPEDVWHVLDTFFSYSGTDIERTISDDRMMEQINKKVKLNELFDFSKFDLNINSESIDYFCIIYAKLIKMLVENNEYNKKEIDSQFKILMHTGVFYLPFECLNISYYFGKMKDNEIEDKIRSLEKEYAGIHDIMLLKAEYLLYKKKVNEACDILKDLYSEVSVRDFVMVYRLTECCEKAGLYEESRQLFKLLTWLNPSPVMFRKIKFLSGKIENKPERELWIEKSEEIRRLEESEAYARELLEEKKYEEAIDVCNSILDKYPLSYPILLLKSLADFGNLGLFKRYHNLDFLISVNPEGVEARRLAATIKFKYKKTDMAINILEPVKEYCYPQYEYLKLRKIGFNNCEKYFRGLAEIFLRSMKEEFPTEPVNPHGLLDLRHMFEDFSDVIDSYPAADDIKKIFDFIEKLKKSKYNHPEEYLDLYMPYYISGKYDKAIKLCEYELKKNKEADKSKEVYYLHKRIFLAAYRGKYYTKALAEIPDIINSNNVPWAKIAVIYEWAGQTDKAEECFKRALESGSMNYPYEDYQELVRFYIRRNHEEKAIETINESVKVCGHNARMYIGLFNIYEDMGREDDAIRCAEMMKKYADGNEFFLKQYHFCLGNAYSGKGDYEKAIECYIKAEKEGCPVILEANMGICYYCMGKYEEAKELFQKKIDRDGGRTLIYLFLIQHCNFFLKGRTDKKIAKLMEERASAQIHIKPDSNKEWIHYLSEAAAAKGQFKKAKTLLKEAQAEKMCPDCGICYELLWGEAWIYIYQGKYREAALCLKKAREYEKNEKTMNADYFTVRRLMRNDGL